MHIMRSGHLEPHEVPDCVLLIEATCDLESGPCGIYIAQRGRCQIEAEAIGAGEAALGINPREDGSLILAEAAEESKVGFAEGKFLGKGSRTVSKCWVETPSDWKVQSRFVFRFDRRLTRGEDTAGAIEENEALRSVNHARSAACAVNEAQF
jgi:acetylornithine deacetylase/succinyl-diaminopimelate desuccinylase-like protein